MGRYKGSIEYEEDQIAIVSSSNSTAFNLVALTSVQADWRGAAASARGSLEHATAQGVVDAAQVTNIQLPLAQFLFAATPFADMKCSLRHAHDLSLF